MCKKFRLLKYFIVSTLLICLVNGSTSQSAIDKAKGSSHLFLSHSLSAEPCYEATTFEMGNACFTLSNDGANGGLSHRSIDTTSLLYGIWALSYPKQSFIEYLFGTSLWIGGIVGSDTLVSVGHDGWQAVQEMLPDVCPNGAINSILPGNVSDHDIIVKFTDTGIITGHNPLGIEVTQKCYVWSGNSSGEFYLFENIVKNIAVNHITNGWIGIYCDADIGANVVLSFTDDLAGYLPNEKIAYIIDNNGDINSNYSNADARGAIGYKFLGSEPPMDNIRFNWWVSNNTSALDWGPRLAGTAQDSFRDFGTGGSGTPEGDANKYYMLSHNEIDYDQIWANTDMTGDGWLPPNSSYGSDFSDGFDARFLYSFGPFELLPGDSIRFFYTMAIGDSAHTDSNNYVNNMPDNPQTYYNNLTFDNLVNLINAAELKYMALTATTDIGEISDVIPTAFELTQNFPNPFNPSTEIEFSIPRAGHVKMSVYNILGQRVTTLIDEDVSAGTYQVTWDGKSSSGQDVSSGMYFLIMQTAESVMSRKMILLK